VGRWETKGVTYQHILDQWKKPVVNVAQVVDFEQDKRPNAQEVYQNNPYRDGSAPHIDYLKSLMPHDPSLGNELTLL